MKKFLKSKYFLWIAVATALTVLLGLVITFVWLMRSKGQENVQSEGSNLQQQKKDGPEPLKNIGFNIDYYDASTKTAGDLKVTVDLIKKILGDPIYEKSIWRDFGVQDVRSPNDPTKRNVQVMYILPLGTKALAPIDGMVIKVEKLYSGDWAIWFAKNKESEWSYELEHVDNPVVSIGQKVTAGQVVAEVSSFTSANHSGFGLLELGLFHPVNNQPTHWCPFNYLDESVRDEIGKKINSFYAGWEKEIGDKNIYKEENYPVPGCTNLDPASG